MCPQVDLAMVWWWVFDQALLVKHQVVLWQCHHSSMFTHDQLIHYVPEVELPACPVCAERVETNDHHFRMCLQLAIPLW